MNATKKPRICHPTVDMAKQSDHRFPIAYRNVLEGLERLVELRSQIRPSNPAKKTLIAKITKLLALKTRMLEGSYVDGTELEIIRDLERLVHLRNKIQRPITGVNDYLVKGADQECTNCHLDMIRIIGSLIDLEIDALQITRSDGSFLNRLTLVERLQTLATSDPALSESLGGIITSELDCMASSVDVEPTASDHASSTVSEANSLGTLSQNAPKDLPSCTGNSGISDRRNSVPSTDLDNEAISKSLADHVAEKNILAGTLSAKFEKLNTETIDLAKLLLATFRGLAKEEHGGPTPLHLNLINLVSRMTESTSTESKKRNISQSQGSAPGELLQETIQDEIVVEVPETNAYSSVKNDGPSKRPRYYPSSLDEDEDSPPKRLRYLAPFSEDGSHTQLHDFPEFTNEDGQYSRPRYCPTKFH